METIVTGDGEGNRCDDRREEESVEARGEHACGFGFFFFFWEEEKKATEEEERLQSRSPLD